KQIWKYYHGDAKANEVAIRDQLAATDSPEQEQRGDTTQYHQQPRCFQAFALHAFCHLNATVQGIKNSIRADARIRLWRIKSEYATLGEMDEGRKRVILIAAAILVARHLKNPEDLHNSRPRPRTESLIASAVQWAERIMRRIDGVFPK